MHTRVCRTGHPLCSLCRFPYCSVRHTSTTLLERYDGTTVAGNANGQTETHTPGGPPRTGTVWCCGVLDASGASRRLGRRPAHARTPGYSTQSFPKRKGVSYRISQSRTITQRQTQRRLGAAATRCFATRVTRAQSLREMYAAASTQTHATLAVPAVSVTCISSSSISSRVAFIRGSFCSQRRRLAQ